jgi:outer membrane protein
MKLQKITLLLFTLFTITVCGQTEQGKFYIGANSNLNFSSSKFETTNGNESNFSAFSSDRTNNFNFTPQIGYFIMDDFVSGLDFKLSYSKTEGQEKNGYYLISPFAKYYFLDNTIKPFIKASYGFGSFFNDTSFISNNGFVSHADISITSLKLGGGVAFILNNYLSLELTLDYYKDVNKSTVSAQQTVNNQAINFKQITNGFASNLGFSIFL